VGRVRKDHDDAQADGFVKADLIEIVVTFRKPKDAAHLERIGRRIVEKLQTDLTRRFPRQLPIAQLTDVRGEDDE
jgi:hypothetical protein